MRLVLECTTCLEKFSTLMDAKDHEGDDEEICGDEYIVVDADADTTL